MVSASNAVISPLVSVIVPAYNQGHYLRHAVQSALDQTAADLEVIVVDDGSTDDTAQVAQSFTDARVRYVHQANRGLSGARNTGLREARGAFLTFLDADDAFLPDKMALLLAEFEAAPELGLVTGQALLIDETGQRTGQHFESRLPVEQARWVLGNPLHVGSVLLRREWQAKVGLFDESLRSYEDWDYWLRLTLAGCAMRTIAQPVSLYRFHTRQMTRDGDQMTTASFAVLDKVFGRADLPAAWQALRDQAYSQAHLRGAAHAYLAGRYGDAQQGLREAVRLHPALLENNARALAGHFSAWTELPKSGDMLSFLDNIYQHLPSELNVLQQRRRGELGRVALRMAFEAHRQGRRGQARKALWQALRYQPAALANRGVLSILLRSHVGWSSRQPETNSQAQP